MKQDRFSLLQFLQKRIHGGKTNLGQVIVFFFYLDVVNIIKTTMQTIVFVVDIQDTLVVHLVFPSIRYGRIDLFQNGQRRMGGPCLYRIKGSPYFVVITCLVIYRNLFQGV